jgi:ribosomal protein L16/L10AE
MRKFIKKCLKKKKFFKKTRKIWVFIRPNHVLSKKAKNARMGKGKGSLTRWCSILPKGFTLIEFLGIPSIRVRKYKIRLEKKFKVPLSMIDRPIRYTKLLKSHFLGSNKTLAVRDFKYNIYI